MRPPPTSAALWLVNSAACVSGWQSATITQLRSVPMNGDSRGVSPVSARIVGVRSIWLATVSTRRARKPVAARSPGGSQT